MRTNSSYAFVRKAGKRIVRDGFLSSKRGENINDNINIIIIIKRTSIKMCVAKPIAFLLRPL